MLTWMQQQSEAIAERANKLQLLRQEAYPKNRLKKSPREKITLYPEQSKKNLPKIRQKIPIVNNNNFYNKNQTNGTNSMKKVRLIGRYSQHEQSPTFFKKWNDSQKQELLSKQVINTNGWPKELQTIQTTTIQFQYKTGRMGKNQLPRTSTNFTTSQHFAPTQSNFNKKSIKKKGLTSINRSNESIHRYRGQVRDFCEQKAEKIKMTKDSQTLLRKNSLFLLSFVKTKQKDRSKKSHIGQMPALTQLNRIRDHNLDFYYERYFDEKRKTQKTIDYKKDRSITYNDKNTKRQIVMQPQPW